MSYYVQQETYRVQRAAPAPRAVLAIPGVPGLQDQADLRGLRGSVDHWVIRGPREQQEDPDWTARMDSRETTVAWEQLEGLEPPEHQVETG